MIDPKTKTQLDARLNRIAGQVAGIQRMLEQERYCVDIVQQVSAARAALAKVSALLLESHIHTCVSEALEGGDKAKKSEKIEELVGLFRNHHT